METTNSNNSNNDIRELIECSTDIAGAAIGGALGFFAAGPAGAAVLAAGGAAATRVLMQAGHEVSERLLGPREKIRVGGVIAITGAEIGRRLQLGEKLREDTFFDAKQFGRSNADEVAEAILLKGQREPEERKLKHFGLLLAGIAFDSTISIHLAHQLTRVAEQLSYRQLCIFKLAATKEFFALRAADYRGQGSFSKELYQILYECLDLYHRGLINIGGEVAFGPSDIAPGKMTIQGLGADIYNLMQLSQIPDDELRPIADVLC